MKKQITTSNSGVLTRITKATFAVGLLPALVLLFGLQSSQADSAHWNLNPVSGDWNTAANWTPNTVPDGPSDVATFAISTTREITVSSSIEVDSIIVQRIFSFYIPITLTISGAGITNQPGYVSSFSVLSGLGSGGLIEFENNARAGDFNDFSAFGVSDGSQEQAGKIVFCDAANAGTGNYENLASGGTTEFHGNSNAADAIFDNSGGHDAESLGGHTLFFDSSTAGNAFIENSGAFTLGGLGELHFGGTTEFYNSSTAGNAVLINSATHDQYDGPGLTLFSDTSTAGQSTIVSDPALGDTGFGGVTRFQLHSTAADATLGANGGPFGEGGNIVFADDSIGERAHVEVTGNANLDISEHNPPGVGIGSLEANGVVFLGANKPHRRQQQPKIDL